jgi:hypothetical protein
MRQAIKRAVRSAYDNFASRHNTLVAQLLIVALLGLIVLSGGRYVEGHESIPVAFEGWQQ